MGVNGGIPGRSGQILAITVWNVLASLGVTESFSEAEIDNVDVVLLFTDSNQEVIGLDISMKEVP